MPYVIASEEEPEEKEKSPWLEALRDTVDQRHLNRSVKRDATIGWLFP